MIRQVTTILFSLFCLIGVLSSARADIQTIPNPSVSSDIGARIRWGATGFEASVYDSNPFGQNPTLNPSGTPVWLLNLPYMFRVAFDGATGTLGLSVDFNRDSSFGAGESITRTAFSSPSPASYAGYGFNYFSISGNEGGSTARSVINNLVINGTSLPSLAPGGTLLQEFYNSTGGQPMTSLTVTGDLTFLTAGTAQERPSWNFAFSDPVSAVPEPSSILLLATTLLGVGITGRRVLAKGRSKVS